MRFRKTFLYKKVKLGALVATLCLGVVLFAFAKMRSSAAELPNDVRVNENDQLTYYITINSDGIDYEGNQSSDALAVKESSGVTKVIDVLPDGLIFEGFVASSDGTFGAVHRDDKVTMCSGRVIDDTNEASVEEGSWNSDNTEYTYHGLHYDANSRTVTFRTSGIGAGCELTVGVITRTPYLQGFQTRMDFYNTAHILDESIADKSNTVHAYIEKSLPPSNTSKDTPKPDDSYYSISYRYDGDIPGNAPALPDMVWYKPGDLFEMAERPVLECYNFEGWKWSPSQGYVYDDPYNLFSGHMPGMNLVFYGWFTRTCDDPEPQDLPDPDFYNVSYEIDGEKPEGFVLPATRSYAEGANVVLDSTSAGETIDGYDFSGWDTDGISVDNDLNFTMPSRDVVLRGNFERDEFTVSYEFLGDVKPSNADALLPATETHYAGDIITTADLVSADGYTFSGWMADPTFVMPEKNVTIYGEWVRNRQQFTPEISIEITNPQPEFYLNDVVNFKITVKNTQAFDLNNVWIEELLEDAIFVPGDGYTISESQFAEIAAIPAGGEASVYAEYMIPKNLSKVYTNTVELISADSADANYSLPDEWDNQASIDFVSGVISDVPIDDGGEEEVVPSGDDKTPKTFDGIGKAGLSMSIMAGGLLASIFVCKRFRRSGMVYGYAVAIMGVSSLGVLLVNGVRLFADSLELRPEIDIYSAIANYEEEEAGSWNVHESAEWTGVGEATLKFEVKTNRIANLHNKDVILVLDNGFWTKKAINGTTVDSESDLPSMELMKNGAKEFVRDLLKDGDSRIIVFATWSDIPSELTSDIDNAIAQIDAIESTDDPSIDNYSVSYDKVINYLNQYSGDEDKGLNIVYVADDHYANSNDIAKYRILKTKAPDASVSSIGFGFKELLDERYTGSAAASDYGVVRYWQGVDGNARPIGDYNYAVNGLELISEWHENPFLGEYEAALIRCVKTSTTFDKFNISTDINLADFNIKGIFGNVGEFEINEGTIVWKNEGSEGFVSGASYRMSIVLQAKDETVEKHKLYSLNTNTAVESDSTDVEAENVVSNEGTVLMNGYELTFNINNSGTCSLGNNETKAYLAFQRLTLDEADVSCEGWNFDTFKDSENGMIYSSKNAVMPAADLELMATWRKTSATKRMDGEIFVAAPAVLKPGLDFNRSLYSIMRDGGASWYGVFLRAEGDCPREIMDDAHRISADDSPTPIYAWVEPNSSFEYLNPHTGEPGWHYTNPTYYCTEAETIKLNEDSSSLFADYYYYDDDGVYQQIESNVEYLDEDVANWDASDVKTLERAFYGTDLYEKSFEYIDNWDVSNVENMDYLFGLSSLSTQYANEDTLSGWDVSNVKSMRYTFANDGNVPNILGGVKTWDTSSVEDMDHIFFNSSVDSFENIENWDVSSVKNFDSAFMEVRSTSGTSTAVDLSPLEGWTTTSAENMNNMFNGMKGDNGIDFSPISEWETGTVKTMSGTFSEIKINDLSALSGWDVSNVEDMSKIFKSSTLNYNGENAGTLIGLEEWTVSSVKDMSRAFYGTLVEDLSALKKWDVSSVENMAGMFYFLKATNLAGLEEWTTSSLKNMTGTFSYGRQLRDLSALSGWDVSHVTTMDSTFVGIDANDVTDLSGWDVSSVEDMSYMFCGDSQPVSGWYYNLTCDSKDVMRNGATGERTPYGGVRSLHGVEGWNTASLVKMNYFIAGGSVTDLTPIAGWDDTNITQIDGAFMRTNLESIEGLIGWDLPNLDQVDYTFAFNYKIKNLHGIENWNVSNLTDMKYTFAYMYALEDITALSGWNTSSLRSMFYTFTDHKKLTSLNGLEDWDVTNLEGLTDTFKGYSSRTYDYYTNWSQYCDSQLNDLSALENWDEARLGGARAAFACNNKLTSVYSLRNLDFGKASNLQRVFEGDSMITSLSGLESWLAVNRRTGTGIHFVEFGYAFKDMTRLRDITALGSWEAEINSDLKPSIESAFRNDRNIQSLQPLENSVLKYSIYMPNAFDGIPSSIARPSWYQ